MFVSFRLRLAVSSSLQSTYDSRQLRLDLEVIRCRARPFKDPWCPLSAWLSLSLEVPKSHDRLHFDSQVCEPPAGDTRFLMPIWCARTCLNVSLPGLVIFILRTLPKAKTRHESGYITTRHQGTITYTLRLKWLLGLGITRLDASLQI